MASNTSVRVPKGQRTNDLPELCSPQDVCRLLGVHKMTFKRWRDDGLFDIEPKVTSAGPIWTRADVEAWGQGRVLDPEARAGSRHARSSA